MAQILPSAVPAPLLGPMVLNEEYCGTVLGEGSLVQQLINLPLRTTYSHCFVRVLQSPVEQASEVASNVTGFRHRICDSCVRCQ
jgi:hypothetical protein